MGRRLINWIVRAGLRLGIGEKNTRLLTVPGRKTGKEHSTPVTLVVEDGEEWLVAPYGVRDWVKNLRAAGHATLSRGRDRRVVGAAELSPEEAAPVIRRYVERVPITREFWDVTPDSPDEALVLEARRHPVFRLTPNEKRD
jgi:deazaflavin-dependent oxidoreductase (nitroreductase family)